MAKNTAANKSATTKGRSSAASGPSPTVITWIAVGVVLAIALVLVVVKVAGNSSTSKGQQNDAVFSFATPAVTGKLAAVPSSVFDTVGVNSSVSVNPPQVFSDKDSLSFTSNGKSLPGVFYDGANYCPYCAAERWGLIVALNRFGSFTGLGNNSSSYLDTSGPNIATFTFEKATYSSKYIAFKAVEEATNMLDPKTGNWAKLQTRTAQESAVLQLFSANSYPFVSIGNKVVVLSAAFDPKTLSNLTREQIAADLADPLSGIGQPIIATANYLSAGICHVDGEQPSTVCSSAGVLAAKSALGIQ